MSKTHNKKNPADNLLRGFFALKKPSTKNSRSKLPLILVVMCKNPRLGEGHWTLSRGITGLH